MNVHHLRNRAGLVSPRSV